MNRRSPFWRGRRVFLTGHTGFKGGWLALWLRQLGAQVHGFSLAPPTEPSLFEVAGVASALASDTRGDVRDYPALKAAIERAEPEVVFHLAAQPLVRASYREPLETFSTNVMGTAHLLDASRHTATLRAVLVVTSDKCYENDRCMLPFRETDPLGGHDPYSGSKAGMEIVAASFRASYFTADSAAAIATVRAGNVIGGGDWAEDRLVPDCIRAFSADRRILLRYPEAVRPWQHVLEPLSGYLTLAEALCGGEARAHAQAWNFGPGGDADTTVGDIAERVAALWGRGAVDVPDTRDHPHEAAFMRLDSDKARQRLGWQPRWSVDRTLKETVAWYKAWHAGEDMRKRTLAQIAAFEEGA